MKYEYNRVCTSCGDIKVVGYKPKGGEECYKCSRAKLGSNLSKHKYKNHNYIRYIYLCRHCPKVLVKSNRSKSGLCSHCNRTYNKKKTPKYEFDFDKMIIICTWEPTKVKRISKPKIAKPKQKKPQIRVSKHEIEKQRELNRKHKESVKYKETIKKDISKKLSDEDMKAEWLKKNKITICEGHEL